MQKNKTFCTLCEPSTVSQNTDKNLIGKMPSQAKFSWKTS